MHEVCLSSTMKDFTTESHEDTTQCQHRYTQSKKQIMSCKLRGIGNLQDWSWVSEPVVESIDMKEVHKSSWDMICEKIWPLSEQSLRTPKITDSPCHVLQYMRRRSSKSGKFSIGFIHVFIAGESFWLKE